jgi:hypothetical protein
MKTGYKKRKDKLMFYELQIYNYHNVDLFLKFATLLEASRTRLLYKADADRTLIIEKGGEISPALIG